MREWFLLLHLLFAIAWYGGVVYTEGLRARAKREGGATFVETMVRISSVDGRLQPVAGSLTIAFGFLLVLTVDAWAFEQVWIAVALVAALAALALVLGVVVPRGQDLARLVAQTGSGEADAMALASRLDTVGHVHALLLTIALVMMVFKPGV